MARPPFILFMLNVLLNIVHERIQYSRIKGINTVQESNYKRIQCEAIRSEHFENVAFSLAYN